MQNEIPKTEMIQLLRLMPYRFYDPLNPRLVAVQIPVSKKIDFFKIHRDGLINFNDFFHLRDKICEKVYECWN